MDPLWHTNRRWHVTLWAFYLILKLMFWIFILKSMFPFGKTPWRDGQVPINRQVDSVQLIFVKCCSIEKIGLLKTKNKKNLWLLAINKPAIFHTRPSTCKYYLHSSLTLSILMCIPLQPRQRGAPSTARSPGRWGWEWGAQRMTNHCHQYHLPFGHQNPWLKVSYCFMFF